MKRQVVRIAAGANLLSACLLLQGCGLYGKKSGTAAKPETMPPVEPALLQPVETGLHPPGPAGVEPAPIELPPVPMTTPYSIRKGDTITGIAYRYSLRWQDVIAVNPGIAPRRLRIGQIIQLPGQVDLGNVRSAPTVGQRPSRIESPAPEILYVVKAGDSLSVIAHRYGVKIKDLKHANGLTGDRINVGQKLKVPNPTKQPAVSAANVKPPQLSSRKSSQTAKPAAPTAGVKTASPAASTAANPETPSPAQDQAVQQPPAPETDKGAGTLGNAVPSELYTVKQGDDIYSIAIRWGVTPSDLKTLNNLISGEELKPGTVLKIPPHEE